MRYDSLHFKGGGVCSLYISVAPTVFILFLSAQSGINVVLGTGYYVDKVHPGNVKTGAVEALAEFMRGEIEDGCEGVRIYEKKKKK